MSADASISIARSALASLVSATVNGVWSISIHPSGLPKAFSISRHDPLLIVRAFPLDECVDAFSH